MHVSRAGASDTAIGQMELHCIIVATFINLQFHCISKIPATAATMGFQKSKLNAAVNRPWMNKQLP
jgi:hypothetical protein